MKNGRLVGRLLFVIGFAGPPLFYSTPPSFPTHQAFAVCPLCPIVDVAFAHPLLWLQIGLQLGIIQGIMFAVFGFTMGCFVSALSQR